MRYYCRPAHASDVAPDSVIASCFEYAVEAYALRIPIDEWHLDHDGASVRIVVESDDEYTPRAYDVVRPFAVTNEIVGVDQHATERAVRGDL